MLRRRICLFSIVSTMAADALVTLHHQTSAAMILIWLSRNIWASVPEGLNTFPFAFLKFIYNNNETWHSLYCVGIAEVTVLNILLTRVYLLMFCLFRLWACHERHCWIHLGLDWMFCQFRFLHEASFGLRVLSLPASVCVCLSVCVCVNHLLVRTITRDLFRLGSPNLDQRCKTPWLRSLLFYGLIDLDLQCQI